MFSLQFGRGIRKDLSSRFFECNIFQSSQCLGLFLEIGESFQPCFTFFLALLLGRGKCLESSFGIGLELCFSFRRGIAGSNSRRNSISGRTNIIATVRIGCNIDRRYCTTRRNPWSIGRSISLWWRGWGKAYRRHLSRRVLGWRHSRSSHGPWTSIPTILGRRWWLRCHAHG